MPTYYKCLGLGQTSCNGGDATWIPHQWMPKIEVLDPCTSGYHVCTRAQVLHWLGAELWEVELQGETLEHSDKLVAQQARITRKLNWDSRIAAKFAQICADRAQKNATAAETAAAVYAAARAAEAAAARAAAAVYAAAGAAARAAAAAAARAAAARAAAARAAARAAEAAAETAERAALTDILFDLIGE